MSFSGRKTAFLRPTLYVFYVQISKDKGFYLFPIAINTRVAKNFHMQKQNVDKKSPKLKKPTFKTSNLSPIKGKILWFRSFNSWFKGQITSEIQIRPDQAYPLSSKQFPCKN